MVGKRNDQTNLSNKLIKLSALAMVALGFGLRLHALASESLWYDELLQLDIAQGPLPSIFPQLPKHSAVPLDYLISHFWIMLGRQDGWVRIPAVVAGTLSLPVAYQLGRAMLGRSEGLLLLALLAFSPFDVRYSQEARPYALVVLGVTLAVYGFWRLRASGQGRYGWPLLAGGLIFSLAHLFATVIFVPLLLFAGGDLLLARDRSRGLKSLAALLGTALVAVAILASLGNAGALYYSTKEFSGALVEPEKFTAEASQKPNHGSGPQVNWPFIRYELISPLGAGGSDTSLWLFNGLAGLGLLSLLVQKRYRLSLLLLLWLILPVVLIVSFLVFRGTFFASRYIISTLPAYLLLLAAGILALPRWLKCAEPRWLSAGAFLLLGGFVWANFAGELQQLYQQQRNENWRLVSHFLAQNAGPDDAIMVVNAESTLNWYYPAAAAKVDSFDTLAQVKARAAQAGRSWVILSIFSTYLGDEFLKIKAWLSEQGAIQLQLDPVISLYYLGRNADPSQLLKEIQGFALPIDHALYASLARENRRDPAVARQYYRLAIEHAPDDQTRSKYQAALEALPP